MEIIYLCPEVLLSNLQTLFPTSQKTPRFHYKYQLVNVV